MKYVFTHRGTIRGCDRRVHDLFRKVIRLRETKLYWISAYGSKYKKSNGYPPCDWPMYKLMLDTVAPL